jgi:hypothetical protein
MAGANVPEFSTDVPVGGRRPAVRASRAGPDEARTLSRRFVRGLSRWCQVTGLTSGALTVPTRCHGTATHSGIANFFSR